MTAAINTASVTTEPSAIYKPRRLLRGGAGGIIGGAAIADAVAWGIGGGAAGTTGTGIAATGVMVLVAAAVVGKALFSAARNACAD
jgi:hypothetical protein